jgi:predicted Fe-Mo cluster-binding NifX family protein
MKILIPVEQANMNGEVSPSFGRAPFFLVYDIEQKAEEFIKNTAADNRGGAGIAAAQLVVDSGAQVLIVPRLGENAAEVLSASNIIIKKSVSPVVKDTIRAFVNSELANLTSTHAGFHGHH